MSLLFPFFGLSSGASVATVPTTMLYATVGGLHIEDRWRVGSVSVRDVLNAAPNTCHLTAYTPPSVGQAVTLQLRTVGSMFNPAMFNPAEFNTVFGLGGELLFAGTVLDVTQVYEGKKENRVWDVNCIDHTAQLNRRRPFGTWVGISATTIAQYLITTYAPTFTSVNVQAALPTVSIIFDGSEDMSSALARLATAVGGYHYVDYSRDLHLFQTEATAAPDTLDIYHPFLNDPPIAYMTDVSQLRDRDFGKGRGGPIPADVLAGDTIVPVENAVLYATAGKVLAGTTPDGAQSQVLTYTGLQVGGGGSLVGPGVAPAAPTVAPAAGTGLGTGAYNYAYTDVTAAGESLPSPIGTVTTGVGPGGAAPTAIGTAQTYGASGSLTVGGTYLYCFTFRRTSDGAETLPGPASNSFVATTASGQVQLSTGSTPPSGYTRKWYRTKAGGSTYFACDFSGAGGEIIGGTWPGADSMFDLASDVGPPVHGGDGVLGAALVTTANQVAISGIAIGPSPTTSRKVYRTAVGAAQLKLLTTLADNTTTTYTDSTADGSLGANVPTGDTSGITFTGGQVNAGATSLPSASAGPFTASGGWGLLPNGQAFRYTGITGNTLTGIPASGVGSLLTTVLYGQQVIPAPALTGVTGLTLAMQKGTPVHVWVQRDDVSAQTAMAALEGGDGIHEYLISDERRGEASLTALCDADLALFSRPLVTVTYATRDQKTRSGKTITINLPAPTSLSGSFTIQDVTIDEIGIAANLSPRYSVTASSVMFSLSDLLTKMGADA